MPLPLSLFTTSSYNDIDIEALRLFVSDYRFDYNVSKRTPKKLKLAHVLKQRAYIQALGGGCAPRLRRRYRRHVLLRSFCGTCEKVSLSVSLSVLTLKLPVPYIALRVSYA